MKQKIGAVSRAVGISTKTIRFYESVGLVEASERTSSLWGSGGQRLFDESDIDRLRFVKEARQLDFSIEEIRQLLEYFESGPSCGCGSRALLNELVEKKLDEIAQGIEQLEALRCRLQELHLRTQRLEGKGPKELLGKSKPTVSDAVLGRVGNDDEA